MNVRTPRSPVPLRRVLVVPCAAALLLHGAVLLRAWPDAERFMDRPDSAEYVALAGNLIDGHGFTQAAGPPYTPDLRRTPVYPAVLAAAFAGSARSPRTAAVLNLALGLALLVPVAAMTRGYGVRVAIGASLLAATDVTSLVYQSLVLTETLFGLLMMLALAVLLLRPADLRASLFAGALFGIAALCRPISVLLAPALLPFMVWRDGRGWRSAARDYVAINLVSGAVVGAWVVRNVLVTGVLTLTSVGGVNMYLHRAAYVEATMSGRSVDDVRAELARTFDEQTRGLSERDRVRWLESHGGAAVSEHPAAYLEASVQSLFRMLAPDREATWHLLGVSPGSPAARAIHRVAWVQLLALYGCVVAGAVVAWRRADSRRTVLLVGLVCGYFIVIGGPEMYSRFRAPLMPLLAVVAGFCFAPHEDRVA